MGSRKLVRDLFLSNRLLHLQIHSQQVVVRSRLPLIPGNRVTGARRFSVLDEFSKKIKGEVESNPELKKSIKDLKEKAGELKGVKEELKVRTKQTTEDLYKRVDGVWTEAEATAKKVSANVKEKISSATEEVKETLGLGKQEASSSTSTSAEASEGNVKDGGPKSEEGKSDTSKSSDTDGSLFGRFKSVVSSATPIISSATKKLKDIKIIEQTKKAYDMAMEELSSNPTKRRRMQYEASSSTAGERSKRTDVVVVPVKQSVWSKKWEAFKDKMNAHPVTKKIRGISEPVVTKGQEIVEDVREHWETSDHPVVHKIQDMNDSVFGESDTALTYKEIRSRDPYFSLPDFVAEVEEMIKPTVNALLKCDVETLKKNCAPQLIERCLAERRAYESQGIFFDNKLLHVSEAEVREVKLMGNTPIIFVNFRTQQLYRVRNKEGVITEGGQDTIHTIYYVWAMQLLDAEEQGEGALYPTWRIREVQQVGIRALI